MLKLGGLYDGSSIQGTRVPSELASGVRASSGSSSNVLLLSSHIIGRSSSLSLNVIVASSAVVYSSSVIEEFEAVSSILVTASSSWLTADSSDELKQIIMIIHD
jgi:hypothetical protein